MLAEMFELLLLPLAWMLRPRRATPEEIKRFYRSAEWKPVRFVQLGQGRKVYQRTSAHKIV